MQNVRHLYEYFEPIHYEIELSLERVKRLFSGKVTIQGRKTSDTKPIMLHAKDIDFSSVVLDDSSVPFSQDGDEVTITAELPAGEYSLTLSFSGHITDAMHGLYPCYYDVDGVKQELLATQFESHHAREVFPCIDEPEAKATFDLTIVTEPDVTVLSNMPKLSTQISDLRSTAVFERTPRMSTYLLAFVVGELHSTKGYTKDGVEVAVYSTKVQPAATHNYALNEAVALVEHYDEYFGIAYPLPKCDHVALPDFSSLAMENWGLITYREGYLLVNESTSTAQRHMISTVIAHELAHQWFGNLVTMRWWDDLWLNESFANLMQYVSLDSLHPEWNIWEEFAMNESVLALSRDQYAHIQPVAYSVNNPDEIAAVFDKAILYSKGSRLIRMVMNYVGETAFREGLREYFKTYAYKNTAGSDLWEMFSRTSGKSVAEIMLTWLTQPGLPLVSVSSTASGLTVAQRRFAVGASTSDALWPIPLLAANDKIPELLTNASVDVVGAVNPHVNKDAVGHFVTHYDAASLDVVTSSPLSNAEWTMLVYETFLLTQAGNTEPKVFIDLLVRSTKLENYALWRTIAGIVGSIRQILPDETTNKFAQFLALPISRTINKPKASDSLETSQLRGIIWQLLVDSNEQATAQQAIDLLHASEDLALTDGNLQHAVFHAAAQYGSADNVHRLVELHDTTHDAYLRDVVAEALAGSHDEALLDKLIARLDQPTIVKPQTLAWWYLYLMRNPLSREKAWQWLEAHWEKLEKKFADDMTLEKFVIYSSRNMSTNDWLKRYSEFFASHTHPSLERAIKVGYDEISARCKWRERDSASLLEHMSNEQLRDTIV